MVGKVISGATAALGLATGNPALAISGAAGLFGSSSSSNQAKRDRNAQVAAQDHKDYYAVPAQDRAYELFRQGTPVAGPSADTLAAQNILRTTAADNFPRLQNQQNYLQDMFLNKDFLQANPGNTTYQQYANGDKLNANPAMNLLSGTANGAYLNSNPYLDATANRAAENLTTNFQQAVSPGIDSSFERAGRYGSGLFANAKQQAQTALAKGLADQNTAIYGGNYAAERQNQLGASNSIGNLFNTAQAQQLAGAQGLSGNYNTAIGQTVQGADAARQTQQQLYDNILKRAAGLSASGTQQDTYNQAVNNQSMTDLQNYIRNISGVQNGTPIPSNPSSAVPIASAISNFAGSNSSQLNDLFAKYFGGNTAGLNSSDYANGGSIYGTN